MSADADLKSLLSEWKGTDSGKFEKLWTRCFDIQFNEKLKPSASCFRENIGVNEFVMDGTGKLKGKKKLEFDGLAVLTDDHKAFDSEGNTIPVILNMEYTVKSGSLASSLNYWTLENPSSPSEGKLIKLMKFLDTKGNYGLRRERIQRLGMKYPSTFPAEEQVNRAYLLGIDRNREGLNLSDHVNQIKNHIDKSFKPGRASVERIDNSESILVKMDNFEIIACILKIGEYSDHLATVKTLEKNLNKSNNMRKMFYDRCLFELTSKIGNSDYALSGTPLVESIPVTVLSSQKPDPTTDTFTPNASVTLGHHVYTHRLRIRLKDLLRMTVVERTLNDVGALQRLPEPSHMKTIAKEGLLKNRVFVNPIVISTTEDFIVQRDPSTSQDYVKAKTGQTFLSPYSWSLIDGQHRAFSGYSVDLDAPALANVEFDVVIQYLNPTSIPKEIRNDINADTFFDLNYRTLPPKPNIALVRSTEISSWPNGWIDRETGRMIYSARVLAARFLLELNKNGPLKDRFGYSGMHIGRNQISLTSFSTYLGGDYHHFDSYFRYVKSGTPDHDVRSIGPYYANWGQKGTTGQLIFPDNKEWMKRFPAYDKISEPHGLRDNEKRGLTCRELEQRGFWQTVAKDFNQFLKEIISEFDPKEHVFTVNLSGVSKNVDWSNSKDCAYIDKNTAVLPGLFGCWFAYVKKHKPPRLTSDKKFDSKIVKSIAKLIENRIHNRATTIPGVSSSGTLFKNSDGKEGITEYTGGNGLKRFREDLIATINHEMGWSVGNSERIEF